MESVHDFIKVGPLKESFVFLDPLIKIPFLIIHDLISECVGHNKKCAESWNLMRT